MWDNTGVMALEDGTLVVSAGTAFTRALHRSKDWGKSWTPQLVKWWALTPLFRDERTLYVSHIDKLGFVRASTQALLKSEDGGASWARQGELPGWTTQLYLLPSPGWLLASTSVGEVYVTGDDGKSWTLQRD